MCSIRIMLKLVKENINSQQVGTLEEKRHKKKTKLEDIYFEEEDFLLMIVINLARSCIYIFNYSLKKSFFSYFFFYFTQELGYTWCSAQQN